MEKDWATGEERKAKIENENAKSPIVNRKSTIPDGQMAPSTQLRIRAPCPVSRIPCPESRPLSRCPEIRGREHGNEFEINEVFPMNRPASQQLRIRCRSEEHTSELQSRPHLVCRLLLEKKK